MTRDIKARAVPAILKIRSNSPNQARRIIAFSLLALGLSGSASAGDGDGPDLAKPNEMATIVSTPGSAQPATAKPSTTSTDRAVLALPGITSRSTARPASPAATPPSDSSAGGIQLDAPLEMKGSLSPLTPLPRVAPPGPTSTVRSSRPLVLEAPSDEPVPMDGTTNRTMRPGGRSSGDTRVEPQPAPATQRRGRLFGLLPPSAPAQSGASPAANPMSLKPGAPGRSIVESAPKSTEDPGEAALKRRIEKQVREAVGDRARSIEVRVVGKSAEVQARGVKLFQKRGVRKSIESIPALTGLRSTIEVVD